MADKYLYNTTTGVIVPDTSEVKTDVQEEFKNALGQDLDVSDSTPQGRLIEAETIARKRVIENMALLANMMNKDQAFGIWLDSLGATFGVVRIGATRTRVSCTLTGTEGTIIPENAQAKDSNGNIYYLENQATIGVGGTTTADFLCMEKGAIECPANSLNQIVTAVIGWTAINNSSAGEKGYNEESDNEYRQNFGTKQYQGKTLVDDVRSAILALNEVKSCFVRSNGKNVNDVIVNERDNTKNITLPPHSLYVCVDGGDNDDIARAIFNTYSIGCDFASSNNETEVTDEGGQTYNIYFDNFEEDGGGSNLPIYVNITVKTGSTNDITESVKEAIQSYANNEIESVDGLKVGVNVNAFEIACAVNAQIPELFVQSVKIGLSSATVTSDNIYIGANEKATISSANITVTQLPR